MLCRTPLPIVGLASTVRQLCDRVHALPLSSITNPDQWWLAASITIHIILYPGARSLRLDAVKWRWMEVTSEINKLDMLRRPSVDSSCWIPQRCYAATLHKKMPMGDLQ